MRIVLLQTVALRQLQKMEAYPPQTVQSWETRRTSPVCMGCLQFPRNWCAKLRGSGREALPDVDQV